MITVNRASRFRASEWVQRIRSEHRIPAPVRNAVRAQGEAIDIAVGPPGSGGRVPTWFQGLVSASSQNNWEITTAEIVPVRTLSQGASSRLSPDLPAGTEQQIGFPSESGEWQAQEVLSHHEPGMVRTLYGITLPSERLAAPLRGQQYWRREGMSETSALLDENQQRFLVDSEGRNRVKLVRDQVASGRGLVVIGTRPADPFEVLITFLHELAVHAGRFSLSVANSSAGWLHGDLVVEAWTREIDRLRNVRPR